MYDQEQESPRAVVVGGGVAGLVAAIRLAQSSRKYRVELYEKSDTFGGRARTTNRDECLFNQGPHALYLGGAAIRSLKELGVEIRGKSPNPPQQLLIRSGRTRALPLTLSNIMKTRGMSWRGKWELLRFLPRLPKLDWSLRQGCTVDDWLNESFRSADMRDFLRLMIRLTTYSNDPQRQSAGVAIRQLQLGLQGVLYLDGGWQSLVDQLVEIATTAGVRIHSHAPVERIVIESGRAKGIVLKDGETIAAQVVIAATTLQQVAKIIPADYATAIHRRAKNAIPVRTACLDIALAEPPRPKQAFALGLDEPLYLSNHSLAAKLANGASVFHAAYYLGEHEEGNLMRPKLEALMDLVQPGWQATMVGARFLPSMIAASALDDAVTGGFVGRPDVAVEDAKGLFVCGDWVGGEGLLVDASAASATAAAKEVSKMLAEGGSPRSNYAPPLTSVGG